MSVWELSDQNPRVVQSQSSLDWCIGLYVHLEAHASAGDNSGSADPNTCCTVERRWQVWECPRQDWEHVGALVTSLGALITCLSACQITVGQSGKNIIFVANAGAAPGNHSYYLSFNTLSNLCIQFVFSSMYLWIYIATHLHSISELAAGGAWEQFKVCLKMMIKWT